MEIIIAISLKKHVDIYGMITTIFQIVLQIVIDLPIDQEQTHSNIGSLRLVAWMVDFL